MKKFIPIIVFALIIVSSLVGSHVFAAVGGDSSSVGGDGCTSCIANPTGFTSVAGLADKIFGFVIDLSYVVIAFFFLLSGFKFITAQGSDSELTKAKTMFWYTVIGALLIIGAKTIIAIFQSIITGLNN